MERRGGEGKEGEDRQGCEEGWFAVDHDRGWFCSSFSAFCCPHHGTFNLSFPGQKAQDALLFEEDQVARADISDAFRILVGMLIAWPECNVAKASSPSFSLMLVLLRFSCCTIAFIHF